MSYYVGDIPAQPLVIEPARGGDPIDIDAFQTVEVNLVDPAGNPVENQPTGALTNDEDEVKVISITWPTASPFEVAGIHVLRLAVLTEAGGRMRLPAVRLAVDDEDTTWYTLDDAREEWSQGPVSDVRLYELLQIARVEVQTHGTSIDDPTDALLAMRGAQLDHARNIWNASHVDPATGDMGDDTFALRTFPLDWAIKQRLRPLHPGKPTVAGLPEGYDY